MPDALPLTGLFGKVPAHGDFVRRGLPTSFVGPWDSWLQEGMAAARERFGPRWAELWDGAPPWRFALPAGACGPDAVAGVLLPSEDMVGRRFPITLAALQAHDDPLPGPAWFAALEAAALAGRAGQADADALAAAIPLPGAEPAATVVVPAGWSLAEPAEPPLPIAAAPGEAAPPPVEDGRDILGSEAGPAEGVDGSGAAPPDTAGNVLDLFGGAPAPEIPLTIDAPAAPVGDVLDIFSRSLPAEGATPTLPGSATPPHMATPDAPAPAPSDGTLAFLLGEGGTAPVALQPAAEGQGDPLAALIAAGDAPLRVSTDDAAPMAEVLPSLPPAAESGSPPDVAMPAPLPPAEPPEPPTGGGWWTGGGGRLPPSVRPLPALLPAADFASLLEADA